MAIGKLGRDTHGTRTATGLWCWIKITKSADGINSDDTFLMLISGKLWEIITYVLSLNVYMMLKFSTYLEVRFVQCTFKGNPVYPYHSPMLRDIIVRPVTFRLHVSVSISEQKMPISKCKMLL